MKIIMNCDDCLYYQSGCFISSEGEPIPIIHKIATIEMIRDWLPTIIEADREGEEPEI